MCSETGGGAYDGTEVARVGHRVEGDDQRLLVVGRREVEQVVGVGILVRRDACRQPLVHGALGHPVELELRHLEQRDVLVRGDREDLAQPAVAIRTLGDVHRGDREPCPQRLDHRVAPGDPLVVAGALARGGPAGAPGGALVFLRLLVGLVVRPVLGLRSRALALESAPDRPPEPAVGLPLPVFLIAPRRCEFRHAVSLSVVEQRAKRANSRDPWHVSVLFGD